MTDCSQIEQFLFRALASRCPSYRSPNSSLRQRLSADAQNARAAPAAAQASISHCPLLASGHRHPVWRLLLTSAAERHLTRQLAFGFLDHLSRSFSLSREGRFLACISSQQHRSSPALSSCSLAAFASSQTRAGDNCLGFSFVRSFVLFLTFPTLNSSDLCRMGTTNDRKRRVLLIDMTI